MVFSNVLKQTYKKNENRNDRNSAPLKLSSELTTTKKKENFFKVGSIKELHLVQVG